MTATYPSFMLTALSLLPVILWLHTQCWCKNTSH